MQSVNQKKIIIALDGYSSSGKSTMAKALAKALGYSYVDTGAMYRAVTLAAMRAGLIDAEGRVQVDILSRMLSQLHITFERVADGSQHTLLNGEDVESQIRRMDVSDNVSAVAALPPVRKYLTELQQQMGRERGIVMDGRDIGTTVFPDAELKIFVNAPAQMRAQRRFKELTEKGVDVSFDDVLANVQNRDHVDETRSESPLRRATDAINLDNSNMSIEQQNQWLLHHAQDAIAKAQHAK